MPPTKSQRVGGALPPDLVGACQCPTHSARSAKIFKPSLAKIKISEKLFGGHQVQIDMVSYFIVDSVSASSPSGRGGPGSPGSGGRREVPLPAPIMYSRVNPCKIQVNLSAMLQVCAAPLVI